MLSLSVISRGSAQGLSEYYAKMAGRGEITLEEAKQLSAAEMTDQELAAQSLEGASGYYKNKDQKDRLVDQDGRPIEQEELEKFLLGQDETGASLFDPGKLVIEKFAREIGYEGELDSDAIRRLRSGVHPETVSDLGDDFRSRWEEAAQKNIPDKTAIDLTFSAPKSVSLLAAFAPEEIQDVVIAAHQQAAKEALEAATELGAFVARRGTSGIETVAARPVGYVQKTEFTSRAGDPQLHAHTLISTAAVTEDGRRTAISSMHIYGGGKSIGQIYQRSLARQLEKELGVRMTPDENGMREIDGIDTTLLRKYSKRSEEVAEKLDEIKREDNLVRRKVESNQEKYEDAYAKSVAGRQLTSEEQKLASDYTKYIAILRQDAHGQLPHKLKDRATIESRSAKAEESEAEARARWAREGHPDLDEILKPARKLAEEMEKEGKGVEPTVHEVITEALNRATRDHHTTDYKTLHNIVSAYAPPSWTNAKVTAAVDRAMNDDRVISFSDDTVLQRGEWLLKGRSREFTTTGVIAQETKIESLAHDLASRKGVKLELDKVVDASIRANLTPEQEELLAAATLSGSDLTIAEGVAGAGKTYALSPIVRLHQEAGYQVVGLATAARTADSLKETGVNRAMSLTRFQFSMESGFWEQGLSNDDIKQVRALQDRAAAATTEKEKFRAEDKLHALSRSFDKRNQKQQEEAESLAKQWKKFKDSDKKSDARYKSLVKQSQALAKERAGIRVPENDKVVLVLDEAAMTNNEDLESVLRSAKDKGWKIITVGDSRQLQGVGRSSGFKIMEAEAGSVNLTTTYRARNDEEKRLQQEWWRAEPGKLGKQVIDKYLDHLDSRGLAEFITDDDLQDWLERNPGVKLPKRAAAEIGAEKIATQYVDALESGTGLKQLLAMASTRAHSRLLGQAIQSELIKRGHLDPNKAKEIVVDSNTKVTGKVHIGEQVRLTSGFGLGSNAVRNGWSGTVEGFTITGGMKIKVPAGVGGADKIITVPKEQLDKGTVTYGTSTIHAAQGRTVEKAWLLADEYVDREALYPGMTRAKAENHIVYAPKQQGLNTAQQRDQLSSQMLTAGAAAPALDRSRLVVTRQDLDRATKQLKQRGNLRPSEAQVTEQVIDNKQRAAEVRASKRAEVAKKGDAALEKLQHVKEAKVQAQQRSRGRGRAA